MWKAFQSSKALWRQGHLISTRFLPKQHRPSSPWKPCRAPSMMRPFHASRPAQIPIIPLPAVILAALKTGKLVSLVSISSKTSLTLLAHTFRRDRGHLAAKLLVAVPLMGMALLVVVGLDQAPNTSRLRLIYLSEDEERELVGEEVGKMLAAQRGLRADPTDKHVLWLKSIVNNLALAAVDDIRDPVRRYDDSDKERQKQFSLDIICDSTTLNAMCAGSHLIVYDLMIYAMEYDTNKMAVILSHEIAHSLQRHFVESHGFASLLVMLGDITRGVFWMLTESLGPYVNQKINETISALIDMETETRYNRRLEKEADLVGLMLLAKAGYNPSAAVEVWTTMAKLENLGSEAAQAENKGTELVDARQFLESLLTSWFGATHPPSEERIAYMRDHLEEATKVYHETLRINGAPETFVLNKAEDAKHDMFSDLSRWLTSLFSWRAASSTPLPALAPAQA